MIFESLPSNAKRLFKRPVPKFTVFFNVLNEPSPVAQGITLKKFERPLVPLNIIKPIIIPRSFRGVQAAGSYKAGHIRKHRITRGRAVNKNKKTKQ